jgi:hypothetical protein
LSASKLQHLDDGSLVISLATQQSEVSSSCSQDVALSSVKSEGAKSCGPASLSSTSFGVRIAPIRLTSSESNGGRCQIVPTDAPAVGSSEGERGSSSRSSLAGSAKVLDTVDTTGDGVVDSVLLDTNGDGLTDAVRRIEYRAAPKLRVAMARRSKDERAQWVRRAMSKGDAAIDTTGDGCIDSVALDTNGDGFVDSLRPLASSSEELLKDQRQSVSQPMNHGFSDTNISYSGSL